MAEVPIKWAKHSETDHIQKNAVAKVLYTKPLNKKLWPFQGAYIV